MPQIILLDADGVVLKKYDEYFSETFAREYAVPVTRIRPFFAGIFKLCQEGKADLREEIEPLLPQWNWNAGVDAFLSYWFSTDAEIDGAVLQEVHTLRNRGFSVYLASDQEKYRARYIAETLGLKNHFNELFFSCDIGCLKHNQNYFKAVSERLHVSPQELSYFDDDPKNIAVAASIGVHAHVYANISQLSAI
jgi:putative hydrolase of the HAD superfamily